MSNETDVSKLFNFRSVAVVGASDDPLRIGGKAISLLRRLGYGGRIYGVNPKYDTVLGEPCVRSLPEIPMPVDLAVFAVSAAQATDQFEAACELGIKAAVIFAGGFAETTEVGRARQRRLIDAARAHGVALNGPNSVGVASFQDGSCATFANILSGLREFPNPIPAGNIALVSQSAGFMMNIYTSALLQGVRFSRLIGTGNEAVLDFSDYLNYLAEDTATTAVIGYMEGLADGAKFCRAADRLRTAGKPLVLIKAGKSTLGSLAAQSHTGQISGEDSAYEAAFRKSGVIRVDSLEQLTDHARLLHKPGADVRDGLVIATTSGGASVYASDLCEASGIPLHTLDDATTTRLSASIPEYGRVENPVDLTGQVANDPSILEECLGTILTSCEKQQLLFILAGNAEPAERREAILSVLVRLHDRSGGRLVLAWMGVPDQFRLEAAQRGLPVWSDPARYLRAAGELTLRCTTVGGNCGDAPAQRVERSEASATSGEARILGEWDAMKLLDDAGIRTPPRGRLRTSGSLEIENHGLEFPVVAKVLEPPIAHRHSVGGVAINVRNQDELASAVRHMAETLGATEILVAEMVQSVTPEFLVGLVKDEVFGFRLTLAAGGVSANYLDDAVTLVPPLNQDYIVESLQRLKQWQAVSASRRPQTGVFAESLADLALRLGDAFESTQETLLELECNPIVMDTRGAIALDALGIYARKEAPGE